MLNQLFARRQPVLCCYCLKWIRSTSAMPTHCSECKAELPPLYVERCEQISPFFVQAFGWSKHGKTLFLAALTQMLVGMGKAWRNGYTHQAATEATRKKLQEINRGLAVGKLPDSTQVHTETKPEDLYIMILEKMERWGGRTLVSRDCAGELFDHFEVPVKQVPFLLSAPTTFMLISLPDLMAPGSGGRGMDDLMTNYLHTLVKHGVNFGNVQRHIVAVLTKADLIDSLPPNLREYLMSDPIAAIVNTPGFHQGIDGRGMAEYVEKMGRVSRAICDWVCDDPPGMNFVQLARNYNIDLRFSVISSTGDRLNPGEPLTAALSPRRVLDPYFWALELQSVP